MKIGPIDAVIVAAGSGARLGADTPKAFVEIGGVPLLRYVLSTLESLGVGRTVVAVPADDIDRCLDQHPIGLARGGTKAICS